MKKKNEAVFEVQENQIAYDPFLILWDSKVIDCQCFVDANWLLKNAIFVLSAVLNSHIPILIFACRFQKPQYYYSYCNYSFLKSCPSNWFKMCFLIFSLLNFHIKIPEIQNKNPIIKNPIKGSPKIWPIIIANPMQENRILKHKKKQTINQVTHLLIILDNKSANSIFNKLLLLEMYFFIFSINSSNMWTEFSIRIG